MPLPNSARRFDIPARESIMSAMRSVLPLCLLVVSCCVKSVDVMMEPTAVPGVFGHGGVGILTAPIPEYPEYARSVNIEGSSRVSIKFAPNWAAESAQVTKLSGNQSLDDGARCAAARTLLDPAPRSRLRTPVYAEIDYRFTRFATKSQKRAHPNADIRKRGLVEITRVRVWSK
jgi:TonB family protein